MNVKCVVTGYLDENCYILSKNGTCLIVDPGDDFLKIKEAIGDDKVLGVLITHSHVDHIGAGVVRPALRDDLDRRKYILKSLHDRIDKHIDSGRGTHWNNNVLKNLCHRYAIQSGCLNDLCRYA